MKTYRLCRFDYLLVLGCLSFILLASSAHAASVTSLQNNSAYTFQLTVAKPVYGSCTPSCVTTLATGATQSFTFSSSTGYIIFDYDVLQGTTKIGHVTLKASPSSVVLTNGLGGTVTLGTSTAQINFTPPTLLWRGEFKSITSWMQSNNWKVSSSLPTWGGKNIEVVSRTDGPKPGYYLRVKYPAGSANSAASPPLPLGGAQFYGAVISTSQPVTLSYYVRFPTNFPFKNATSTGTLGKLPGLYGGKGNTGDNVPTGTDGWSIRFMWCDYSQETKRKLIAGGEIVQFTALSNQGLYGTDKGKFIGCGTWSFAPDGKWHNIQQTIHLNDLGKANGQVDVCYDGKLVYTAKNITFRTVSTLGINGVLFQTFFGGSGKEYATPISTYADFAGFEVYAYPATAPMGLCITP